MIKKQFFTLVVIVFLAVVLVLAYFFVTSRKKVGEYRSKAAGEISVFVSPSSQTVNPGVGNQATVQVKVKNITGAQINNLKVVSATLRFGQSITNIFTVAEADIVCDPTLSTKTPSSITGTTIYFTCANMGTPFSLNSQEEKTIASINLHLVSGAPSSATINVSVEEPIIPDQNLNNLGGIGLGATITIGGGGPTNTPTPTTPAGQPTNTPTKTPTPTRTPTPTIPAGQPTNTPTPTTPAVTNTPSPTPTGAANTFSKTLLFALKGVGASSDQTINNYRNGAGKASMKITIYNRDNLSLSTGAQTYDATYITTGNETGLYRVNLINVPNSFLTNAIILVKADRHLGAKFCYVGQAQRCDAATEKTQSVNFSTGDTLVFSQYPLLPGDVDQNGVLNGADLISMQNELKRDPTVRDNKYDLNYDGIVRFDDYNLMQDSMVVFDDE